MMLAVLSGFSFLYRISTIIMALFTITAAETFLPVADRFQPFPISTGPGCRSRYTTCNRPRGTSHAFAWRTDLPFCPLPRRSCDRRKSQASCCSRYSRYRPRLGRGGFTLMVRGSWDWAWRSTRLACPALSGATVTARFPTAPAVVSHYNAEGSLRSLAGSATICKAESRFFPDPYRWASSRRSRGAGRLSVLQSGHCERSGRRRDKIDGARTMLQPTEERSAA